MESYRSMGSFINTLSAGYDAGFHFPQERRKVCDYDQTTLVRIARVIASPVSMISASL